MNDRQKIAGPVRDRAPCDGCTERFTACSDRCPKDERGAYGYKAFRKRIDEVNEARRRYALERHNSILRRK